MKHTSTDGTRYYQIGDKQFPSVTSILSIISKPNLIAWASRQGSYEKMKATQTTAMNIGSEAHKLIEIYLKNPELIDEALKTSTESAVQAYTNFLDWSKQADFKIIHSEFVCYSKTYGYAGTADGIVSIGGKLCVADWKTSSGCWNEYWLQCEAYLRAIEEMIEDGELKIDGKIENRVILRLPKKEAGFFVHEEPKNIQDFLYFLSAKDLWEGMNELDIRYSKHRKTHANKN